MDNATLSIEHWMKDVKERQETDRSLFLALGEIVAEIRSNEEKLIDSLRAYFEEFVIPSAEKSDFTILAIQGNPPPVPRPFILKPPDPGKTRIKEEYLDLSDGRVVRKRLTGMIFYFGPRENLAVGDCLKNDNQVVNFINNRYIQWQLNRNHILGHAAAVRMGEAGLALAGFSGAGKSSLALHVMDRGATFVSNDRLLIRKSGAGLAMSGVAKMPRVNPGTILSIRRLHCLLTREEKESFACLPPEKLWQLEQKYDVPIGGLYGPGRFQMTGPLNALVLLTWKPNGDSYGIRRVHLADRPDLLEAFIKAPGLFYEPEELDPTIAFSEEVYLDHLSRCDVYEIFGGVDFSRAADDCLAILMRGLPISVERT